MKKNIKSTYNFAKDYPFLFFRIFLIFSIGFILLTYFSINTFADNQSTSSQKILGISTSGNSAAVKSEDLKYNTVTELPVINVENIKLAEQKRIDEEKRLAEIQRKLAIRQGHINRINSFLIRKHSPIANTDIPALIFDLSEKYSADYRLLLAITGVESGFCAQAFHYNCFGFINGRHYAGYTDAFTDLIPKVAARYTNVYGTNFVALAKVYGMVNWEKGAANLSMYYHQI